MAAGHIIAVRGAPILDFRGIEIIAHWDRDLVGAQFDDRYAWRSATKRERLVASFDDPPPRETAVAYPLYSVRLQFSRGPCQIWQMETEVKDADRESVFGWGGLFTIEPTGDPDDPHRVHRAARALLNATRTHLSHQTRDELEFLSQRLQHQIEARAWR